MANEDWPRVEELLDAALELPAAQRAAFLNSACRDSDDLRQAVDSLLRLEDRAEHFLEEPAANVLGLMDQAAFALAPGSSLGAYRLLRELGSGGMSKVFLASRQDEQYRHEVAIKVVRYGSNRTELRQRFLKERQILANLSHPHIARLFDGGTTDDGLPYFAMEYIEGHPIVRYCDQQQLELSERIEIFLSVCEAVHHAHQNLVIHCDIKPSNILVTEGGSPKLLDFGIAKLLQPELGGNEPEQTVTRMRLLTPSYASPEQLGGRPTNTATDVYSLGVVLHELLTGYLPRSDGTVEAEILAPSSLIEGLRRLGEEAEAAELNELCAHRGTQPARLSRALRADLDAIVLRALQPDPRRRYGSVQELTEDLCRYQRGLPVLARRGSLRYRAGKFLRRNALAVIVGAAVASLMLGSAVMAGFQAARLDREQLQTEEVAEFLIGLFQVFDASPARAREVTAYELLERGAEGIGERLEEQPLVRATLETTIGRAYHNLGFYERATELFTEARQTRQALLGPEHPEVAEAQHYLGEALARWGRFDASIQSYEKALEVRRSSLGPAHPKVADTVSSLALLEMNQGRLEAAETHAREALSLRERNSDSEPVQLARAQSLLASVLFARGRYEESTELLSRAVPSLRRLGPHPDLALALKRYGSLLINAGDPGGAIPVLREAAKLTNHVYGDDHPEYADSLIPLGIALSYQGDYEAAEPVLRESLDLVRERFGDQHFRVAVGMFNLATVLFELEQYSEAEAMLRRSLELGGRFAPPFHPKLASLRSNLAMTLHAQGEIAEARELFDQAVPTLRVTVGSGHPDLAAALLGHGVLLIAEGDFEGAEEALTEALATAVEVHGAEHWRVASIQIEVARCLAGQGQGEAARQLAREAIAIIEAQRGKTARDSVRSRRSLAAIEEMLAHNEPDTGLQLSTLAPPVMLNPP